MATTIPEALAATRGGVGITDSLGYEHNNSQFSENDYDGSSASISILYPRSATVLAAICASIFTIVGIGGKNLQGINSIYTPMLLIMLHKRFSVQI